MAADMRARSDYSWLVVSRGLVAASSPPTVPTQPKLAVPTGLTQTHPCFLVSSLFKYGALFDSE